MLSFDQITHQVVLSTDRRASFAAFIYDNASVGQVNSLATGKLIGFDAGDGIRSATVQSSSFSSLPSVSSLNIFRVDGNTLKLILQL